MVVQINQRNKISSTVVLIMEFVSIILTRALNCNNDKRIGDSKFFGFDQTHHSVEKLQKYGQFCQIEEKASVLRH